MDDRLPAERLLECGVVAGPLFITTFTVLGACSEGYRARRDPVSLLAIGQQGWVQRTNFVVAGVLYVAAAAGLARDPGRLAGSVATPALIAGAGLGLIGSGTFLTGSRGERLPAGKLRAAHPVDREELLHSLCAVPIFAGIPAAAAASARGFSRGEQKTWASYSRCSGLVTATTFLLFSTAFGQAPRLREWGGLLQRASIVAGFGWLTAISVRARRIVSSHSVVLARAPTAESS